MDEARSLEVLLKRNDNKDHEKGGISYTGWDIYWPDGSPTNVDFSFFCKIGMRSLFGRNPPEGGEHHLTLIFAPCEQDAEMRRGARRLYLLKSNGKAVMHLSRGDETPIVFSEKDDNRVLQWIGWDCLCDGEPQWFDFLAEQTVSVSQQGPP